MKKVNFYLRMTFVLLFFCISILSIGQNFNLVGDIIPQTPNAASLGKYGDVPVSNHTGVPNTNIPIYTVTDGPISLPISLNYHSGGIRVSEVSSSVGLGWTLGAGGAITRTVRNLPDEGLNAVANGFLTNDAGNLTPPLTTDELLDASEGQLDTEPDIFFYNFNGYSGKFFFDKDQEVHFLPHQNIKLEYTLTSNSYNNLAFWKLTGPDGTKYYFGDNENDGIFENDAVELSNNYWYVGSPPTLTPIVNAWYLVRVESANGDHVIDLDYEFETYRFSDLGPNFVDIYDSPCQMLGYDYAPTVYQRITEVRAPRLKEITTSYNTVSFDYSNNPRQDLDRWTTIITPGLTNGIVDSPRALEKINIFGSGGECMAQFEIVTDYFKSNVDGFGGAEIIAPIFESELIDQEDDLVYFPDMKRLRLRSLTQLECGDGERELVHSFEYYEKDFENQSLASNEQLPRRKSHSQDHWGFYNGANNISLLPKITLQSPLNTGIDIIDCVDAPFLADREPSFPEMQVGTLSKITYPTGGNTAFSYEGHTYNKDVTEFLRVDGFAVQNDCSYPGACNCTRDQTSFVIEEGAFNIDPHYEFCNFNFQVSKGNFCEQNKPDYKLQVRLFICKTGGGFPNDCWWHEWYMDQETTNLMIDQDGLAAVGLDLSLLEPGEYDFRLELFNPPPEASVFMSMSMNCYAGQTVNQNILVGGLRIASIISDPVNSNPISKRYNYGQFEEPEKSSGFLVGLPSYLQLVQPGPGLGFPLNGGAGAGGVCILEQPFFIFNSRGHGPMSTTQGSHIGYENVQIISGDGGKSNFYYDKGSVIEPSFLAHQFPVIPENETPLLRGSLLKEEHFTDEEILVASTEYKYEIAELENIQGIKIEKGGLVCFEEDLYSGDGAVYSGGQLVNWAQYNIKSGIVYLTEKNDMLDGVYSKTTYKYNNNWDHTYPIKIITINEESGVSIITDNQYAYDVDIGYPGASLLKDKHIINALLISEQSGDIIDGTKIEYHEFGSNVLPYKVYTKEKAGWVERATVSTYDGVFPTTYVKTHFPPEIYTWNGDKLISKTYSDRSWSWEYYEGTRELKKYTAPGELPIEYFYDGFRRLDLIHEREGAVKTNFEYIVNGPGDNITRSIVSFTGGSVPIPDRETQDEYDGLGRALKNIGIGYGPEGQNIVFDGADYDGRGRNVLDIYLPSENGTFTSFIYEASPLDRIVKRINPDNNFEEITYGNDGTGAYFKSTVYDENGNPATTLTNIVGQIISIQDALGGITNYEYDSYGNLKRVTSPAGTYGYEYDVLNRLKFKTVPGQLGNTKYTYTERDEIETITDPNGNIITHTYNDHSQLITTNSPGGDILNKYNVERLTYQHATSPSNPNPSAKTIKTFFYDEFNRLEMQTLSTPYGSDTYNFEYDAADNLINSVRNHEGGVEELNIYDEYNYDHSGRMQKKWQSINDETKRLIVKNSYTTRDELKTKRLYSTNGGNTFLQKVDYGYNAMGWLEKINGTEIPVYDKEPSACELPFGNPSGPNTTDIDLKDLFDLLAGGGEITFPGWEECEDPTPNDPPIPTYKVCDYSISIPILQEETLHSINRVGSGGSIPFVIFNPPLDLTDPSSAQQIESRLTNALYSGNYVYTAINVTYISEGRDQAVIIEVVGTDLMLEDVSLTTSYQSQIYKEPFTVSNCTAITTPLCDYIVIVPSGINPISAIRNIEEKTLTTYNPVLYPNGSNTPNQIENSVETALTTRGFSFGSIQINTVSGGLEIRVNQTNYVFGYIQSNSNNRFHFSTFCGNEGNTGNCVDVSNPPICTDEEIELQNTSIDLILTELANFECPEPFVPITLILVQFCDGTTLWMVDYMEDLIGGGYNVIGTTVIDNPEQTITVIVPNDNDLFKMDLNYYDGAAELQALPYKNGNISWMKWQIGDRVVQAYGFQYDVLDRLNKAYYTDFYSIITGSSGGDSDVLSINSLNPDLYSVPNISYDGAGNILNLKRNGWMNCQPGVIDNLTYYNNSGTKRLDGVIDSASDIFGFTAKSGQTSYSYDNNGNLITAPGKNITSDINYNSLNLPTNIYIDGDQGGAIEHEYDALGQKLKKTVIPNQGEAHELLYINEVEYKNGILEGIYTEEGRIVREEIEDEDTGEFFFTFRYEFTLGDHLNNNRVTFSDLDGNGFITTKDFAETEFISEPVEVLQETHYYPFGMSLDGNWIPLTGTKNHYLYNNKELDKDFGLNWYKYGERLYDPSIGRFTGVDPIADQFAHLSVYNYADNSPISNADLHGLQAVFFAQAEVRGSFGVFPLGFGFGPTLSAAFGAFGDLEGNLGIYGSFSLGAQSGGGGSVGIAGGVAIADNMFELEGWGLNIGAFTTPPSGFPVFAGEFNFALESPGFEDATNPFSVGINPEILAGGVSIGTPISVGFGASAYGDISFTYVFDHVNLGSLVENFMKSLEDFVREGLDDHTLNRFVGTLSDAMTEFENQTGNIIYSTEPVVITPKKNEE